MEIKTKCNIGDRVWVLYEDSGDIIVSVDRIEGIVVTDGKIVYIAEKSGEEYNEEDVIPYEDGENLIKRIRELLENC
jgi:hypothetical protein